VPQSIVLPQPSPWRPHIIPSWAHVTAQQVGSPHTLGTPAAPQAPPPPQSCFVRHVPQLIRLPQLSAACPQLSPSWAHVFGTHAQTLVCPPPPQVWPEGQGPQSRPPPQPSLAVPQSKPCSAQLFGVQHALFQQTAGGAHPPQSTTPPHPSSAVPHPAPTAAHVLGTQLVLVGRLEVSPELVVVRVEVAPLDPPLDGASTTV
jgi:hypothetical protein